MKASSQILRRFFTGLTEHVFQTQLGLAEPKLTDYLAAMLVRLIRTDQLHKVRDISGRPVTEIVDMVNEAEARFGVAKRRVHQHIGDFTLFWAGLYPEALKKLCAPNRKDHFVDFCVVGKRSYFRAAHIVVHEEGEVGHDVLLSLSYQFELCAYGLREVRREWESRGDEQQLPPVLL